MHKARLDPQYWIKLGHTPVIPALEERGGKIKPEGPAQPHDELKASLGYMRPYLKKKDTNQETKQNILLCHFCEAPLNSFTRELHHCPQEK